VRDALHALSGGGCAVCRAGASGEERFVFSFVTELYGEPHMLDAVRASRGFCPAHTRTLLRCAPARYAMRLVYAEVVDAALASLATARLHTEPRTCPACVSRSGAEDFAIYVVRISLRETAVVEAYRAARGFCFPHALGALRGAGIEAASVLLGALLERLDGAAAGGDVIQSLANHDADASARHDLLQRLGDLLPREEDGRRDTTLDRFLAPLRVAACPCCLAGGLMERLYLDSLAVRWRRDSATLATEGVWLCSQHLHDLDSAHRDAAERVAQQGRALLQAEVARWWAGREALPGPTLAARVAAARAELQRRDEPEPGARPEPREGRWLRAAAQLLRRRDEALRSSLAPLLRDRRCDVCHAVQGAEDRERRFVQAALLDRPTAAEYERAHGLCLRHVLELDDAACPLPARVLRARLSVLAWELAEAGRKSAWSARHEPGGGECDAWLRAPALLDGRAFCGGPAHRPS
jgi:hypothetical protein